MTARVTAAAWALSRRVGGSLARVFAAVDSPPTVVVAAAAAFLLRLPWLGLPPHPDEAGFLLVARTWDPQPDSVYGPHFVDRPPLLIAVFRLCDAVGGDLGALGGLHLVRFLGAVGCLLLVLAAAQVARLVSGAADDHAARWTAVATAAFVSNPFLDVVAVKGELLALPVLMTSMWLSLVALRNRSVPAAAAAGLLGGIAQGFKQNLVGALVFGAVLLLIATLTRRLPPRDLARLGAAAAAAALVPVMVTLAWAAAVGVRLDTLIYTVYGFRADAARVLTADASDLPVDRAVQLGTIAVVVGMVFVIGGFVVHLRDELRLDPPVTLATAALLGVDTATLVLSGSFWNDYLFPLVPGTALCAALLSRRRTRRGLVMRLVIVFATVSSVVMLGSWTTYVVAGKHRLPDYETGLAISASAEPGDTLVVYGGRANLQLASGLRSPYEELWSLPMRARDPEYAELRSLLAGTDAPTWFVEWVDFDTWDDAAQPDTGPGDALERVVERRYVLHGYGCNDHPVYLLRGVERPPISPTCSNPIQLEPARPSTPDYPRDDSKSSRQDAADPSDGP